MATSAKDYRAMAARFSERLAPTDADPDGFRNLTFAAGIRVGLEVVAEFFAADNPRFDRERFYAAADPGMEEIIRRMAEDDDPEEDA